MQYKSKRILAMLLLVCMLISSFPNIMFAAPGGDFQGGDGGSSGASYNEGTGSADITTGTSSGGADKIATRDRWAVNEITYLLIG